MAQIKRNEREIKRHGKEIEMIDLCVRYIQTNPSAEFIASEITRINQGITVLDNRFKEWYAQPGNSKIEPKKARTVYGKWAGITDRKQKLNFLNYLQGNEGRKKS